MCEKGGPVVTADDFEALGGIEKRHLIHQKSHKVKGLRKT